MNKRKRYLIYSSNNRLLHHANFKQKQIFVIFENKCIKNVKNPKRQKTKKSYIARKFQKKNRNIELLPNINAIENAFDIFTSLKTIKIFKIVNEPK